MARSGETRQDDPLHLDRKADAAQVHSEHADDVLVFVVETENIYPKQAGELAAYMKAAIQPLDSPRVLVDLDRVRFACSAFVGQLISIHKLVAARGGDMKVFVTDEHVAYTVRLVKLHKLLDVGDDREQLIGSF